MIDKKWAILAVLLTLPPAHAAAQEGAAAAPGFDSPASRYTEGIYCESATGDLGRAVTLYEQVIESSKDASLVARATLRLGSCREKLGQTDLARAAYRRVVEDFGSRRRVARLARLALLALGPTKEQLDRWTYDLGAEVAQLKSALEALTLTPGPDSLKAGLAAARKKPSVTARLLDDVIDAGKTRAHVEQYLASCCTLTGLHAYQSLDYARALEDFLLAVSLRPGDELVLGYLERTEFILGRRAKLTPAAKESSADNPGMRLRGELSVAFELAKAAAGRRDYRAALAMAEELLDHARWTDDRFVTPEVEELLERADSLADDCALRLFPAEAAHLLELKAQRENLADAIKRKLRAALGRGFPLTAETQRTRGEAQRRKLEEKKKEKDSSLRPSATSPRLRGERTPAFSIQVAAISMPPGELDALNIPFTKLPVPGGEGSGEGSLEYAVLSAGQGRQILTAAALAGPGALSRLPDVRVPAGRGRPSFVSAFSSPAAKLDVKLTAEGDAVIVRMEMMTLRHTLRLGPGECLVIGPVPVETKGATEKETYLLLTPARD